MKKIILSLFVLFCFNSYAQLEIAPWDFQNGDTTEGWTIIDNDNANGSTWDIRSNFYSVTMGADPITVFGLTSLGGPGSADEWAILPVQDMSYYTGTHLNLTYLRGFFEAETDMELLLYAYVSEEVPTITEFLTTEPVATISITGDYNDPPVAATIITDIPAALNVANVHFALVYRWTSDGQGAPTSALEFTKISITADDLAGVDAPALTFTTIKTNPVTDNLQLILGSSVNPATAELSIYNATGALVKKARYDESGILVEGLASGMYFTVLQDGATSETLKFIKR